MTGVWMFVALAAFTVGVCVYGWWNDPVVRYRREMRAMIAAVRRVQVTIGEQLIPAFEAMTPAVRDATASILALGEALGVAYRQMVREHNAAALRGEFADPEVYEL